MGGEFGGGGILLYTVEDAAWFRNGLFDGRFTVNPGEVCGSAWSVRVS